LRGRREPMSQRYTTFAVYQMGLCRFRFTAMARVSAE
jgi:hypothetical protein